MLEILSLMFLDLILGRREFRMTTEQLAEAERLEALRKTWLQTGAATVVIRADQPSPGYPRPYYSVSVKNPIGSHVNRSLGFRSLNAALKFAKKVVKVCGYLDLVVTIL